MFIRLVISGAIFLFEPPIWTWVEYADEWSNSLVVKLWSLPSCGICDISEGTAEILDLVVVLIDCGMEIIDDGLLNLCLVLDCLCRDSGLSAECGHGAPHLECCVADGLELLICVEWSCRH